MEETNDLNRRLEASLAGIAIALVHETDIRIRAGLLHQGCRSLRIRQETMYAIVRWQIGDDMRNSMNFTSLVVQVLVKTGEFTFDEAAKIGEQIVKSVLKGEPIIPGFMVEDTTDSAVLLVMKG